MSAIIAEVLAAHQLTRVFLPAKGKRPAMEVAGCTCKQPLNPPFNGEQEDHVYEEIEAAVRRACAAEIRAVASDPDALRPLSSTATRKTDFANDFEWAAIAIEQPIGGVL